MCVVGLLPRLLGAQICAFYKETILCKADIDYCEITVFKSNLFPAEVELPFEYYELELRDSIVAPGGSDVIPVAKLDVDTVTVTAIQLGQISLVFVHKSIL